MSRPTSPAGADSARSRPRAPAAARRRCRRPRMAAQPRAGRLRPGDAVHGAAGGGDRRRRRAARRSGCWSIRRSTPAAPARATTSCSTAPRFPVYRTGRGGRITYHGPGQRVGYVMLDLRRRGADVRVFVATAGSLADRQRWPTFGVEARRSQASRHLGRPRPGARGEDRRHRRPRPPLGQLPRLRAERRPRPVALRRHRPVRPGRAAGDLARRPRRRGRPWPRSTPR